MKLVPLMKDATEHVIKHTAYYANYGSWSEHDFQAMLHAVEREIEKVPSHKTNKFGRQTINASMHAYTYARMQTRTHAHTYRHH